MAVGKVVAEVELLDDVVAETTAPEILHAHGQAVDIVVKNVLKVLFGPIVDDEHALALALLAPLLVGQLTFFDLNVVFVGQPSEGFGIVHLLMFHDEPHGVAPLAATETMTGASRRRHVERRGLLVMERTQPFIIDAALVERYKLRYYVHNIGGVLDTVYRLSVDHSCKDTRKQTNRKRKRCF